MVTPRTGRPRGRPKGSKNKPKTAEEFILESLANPPPPPPRKKSTGKGRFSYMTPEERSAESAKMAAARKAKLGNSFGQGRKRGSCLARTAEQQARFVAEQTQEAKRIIKKMAAAGDLPDDPKAVEALEKTLVILRTAESPKDKLTAARLLLDFTKAKPTAKVEHTIKTAEDLLDEMAEDDDQEDQDPGRD